MIDMREIEREGPDFRGFSSTNISPENLLEIFTELLNTSKYNIDGIRSQNSLIEHIFTSNKDFWHAAINSFFHDGMRIQLNGFHLTEWIPFAPGKYFTREASKDRSRALHFINRERIYEYLPQGKSSMIGGGIGSVRLSAKSLLSNTYYILGASSTGISHQGIPVALPEKEHFKIIRNLRKHGGCLTNLVGTIRIIPLPTNFIEYGRNIPKVCLFIDKIEEIRPSFAEELMVSVAIAFRNESGKLRYSSDFAWSFCSFSLDSSDNNLNSAVDWLLDYVLRHFHTAHPSILNDFDEMVPHFDCPVQFPLRDVTQDNINIEKAQIVLEHGGYVGKLLIEKMINPVFKHAKGDIVEGDQIHLQGTFQNVNVKSTLTNVTQRIGDLPNVNQAEKDQLIQLIEELSKLLQQVPPNMAEDAEIVSKRVETIVEEAKKPNPDKALVEFSKYNLTTLATKIAQVLPPVFTIVTEIVHFVSNIIH